MRVKLLLLTLIAGTALVGCWDAINIDAEKLLMTQKMHQKVSAITKDLSDYCDAEMYRKAKLVADAMLLKRKLKVKKKHS